MRKRLLIVAAFLATVGGPGTGLAQDVQVNTFTTSSQYRPAVGTDANGDFVVVWVSLGSPGTDSDGFSIQGQRFAGDGSPVGGQFQVNTYTTSDQRSPAVELDADGDFVVVWTSDGSSGTDTSSSSVQGQRYAADGSTIGPQFQVNSFTTGEQIEPAVAVDADGDFVVVWTSDGSSGTDSSSYSVQGQRYADDGSPAGAQFQVNTYTADEQTSASVAIEDNGDFAVAWRSATSTATDTSADSVHGRRFAADGSPLGGQFQVNTFTTGVQTSPAVAMDSDGDFVVAWQSDGSDGTDTDAYSIQVQRYAADGTPTGAQVQVNTYTTSLQFDTSVGMDAAGDFVVVWNSFGSSGTDTSGPSILGQRFAADGSTVAAEVQVNTYTTGFQDTPSIAVDADGDFVVVWTSSGSFGTDTSGYSIQKTPPDFIPVELLAFSVE